MPAGKRVTGASTEVITAADQLELFLTRSGGGGGSSRGMGPPATEGPSAAHYHFSRTGSGDYPMRTSSPATAALAAAAAIAMKEHEAEMLAKANAGGAGGRKPGAGLTGQADNVLLSDPLEALFPATGKSRQTIHRYVFMCQK